MKLVLTESQVKTIQENLQHRKMFQKYWERFGPGVDENFLNLFGFKRGNLDGMKKRPTAKPKTDIGFGK